MDATLVMGKQGPVVIPADVRAALGLAVLNLTVVRSTARRSERDEGAQSRPELTATTTPASALGR